MKGYDIEFNYQSRVIGLAEANCDYTFNNGLNLTKDNVEVITHDIPRRNERN